MLSLPETGNATEEIAEMNLSTVRRYHGRGTCSVRHVADRLYRLYECISEDADACPYVMTYRDGHYCIHPDCPSFKEADKELKERNNRP